MGVVFAAAWAAGALAAFVTLGTGSISIEETIPGFPGRMAQSLGFQPESHLDVVEFPKWCLSWA